MKYLFLLLLIVNIVYAKDKIRVGVLSFGTVNWELETIKKREIDEKNGIEIEVVKLASKNGVSISLLGKKVDVIVTDFVWANRQNQKGYDFVFYPYSKAIGSLYVKKEIESLEDLKGKNLGVANSRVNKTWILLRAYYNYIKDEDLKDNLNLSYASPPILNKKLLDGTLDGVINFWHYNARLEAKGMKKLIDFQKILPTFGIKSDISFIGWVFSKEFAKKNRALVDSFLDSTLQAKRALLEDSRAWEDIRYLTKSEDDRVFEALKSGYKEGVVTTFTKENRDNIKELYKVLAKYGGESLIGRAKSIDDSLFYDFSNKREY